MLQNINSLLLDRKWDETSTKPNKFTAGPQEVTLTLPVLASDESHLNIELHMLLVDLRHPQQVFFVPSIVFVVFFFINFSS